MKKAKLFLLFPLLLTLTFTSCTNDANTKNANTVPQTKVTVSAPETPKKIEKTKNEEKIKEKDEPSEKIIEKPKIFKKNDAGDEVKVIQQKLNKFGYNLKIDGSFGTKTLFAVTDFQKRNKLKITGEVDSNTIAYLDKKPTPQTTYKPPVPTAKPTANNTESLEKYVNSRTYVSETNYFIWIDLQKQKVHIFSGSNENWKLVKSMICSSGKASTPTIKGLFTVGNKGSYFISDAGARCKYFTQISGRYLFHSILYDRKGERIIDGRLGIPLSHGCIRLAPENAKYIYDNIPRGTLIWSN